MLILSLWLIPLLAITDRWCLDSKRWTISSAALRERRGRLDPRSSLKWHQCCYIQNFH